MGLSWRRRRADLAGEMGERRGLGAGDALVAQDGQLAEDGDGERVCERTAGHASSRPGAQQCAAAATQRIDQDTGEGGLGGALARDLGERRDLAPEQVGPRRGEEAPPIVAAGQPAQVAPAGDTGLDRSSRLV